MSAKITGMGYKRKKMIVEITTPEHTTCNMWDLYYECDHECETCGYLITIPESKNIYAYKIKRKEALKELKILEG